jgi:tetratricopeptide (TPR) repeat protein
MVITLPLVLLACAWWRRGSITRRDIVRVVPYVLIGALMAGVEIWTQHADEDVRSDSLMSRTAVAGCAVWFYFGKLVWPLDLSFVYPRWEFNDLNVFSFLPGLLLAIVFALALWRRQTWGRPVVMLIVCYVPLLLPALGFVNIYFMKYSLVADHWQYAATIVPCAMLAAAAAAWTLRRPRCRVAACVLGVTLLVVLAGLSWRQSRIYADFESLWNDTLAKDPSCWMAHNNLGRGLKRLGQVDEAMVHYQKALEIRPDFAEAHYNLANALAGRGQFEAAIAHYRKALEFKPDYVKAHVNLGAELAGRGQVDEAIDHYRSALQLEPDHAEAHNNLANALAGRGDVDEAIDHYRKALQSNPDYALAHNNLGAALAGRGQSDEAIDHYRAAVQIQPEFLEARYNLASALAASGRVSEALEHYQIALDLALAKNNRSLADTIRAKMRNQ